MAAAEIRANSSSGCDDCVYRDPLPEALRSAGMDEAQWAAFLAQANAAVRYDWVKVCCVYGAFGMCGLMSFLCNCHNKTVRGPMERFCAEVNSAGGALLPVGVVVRYELRTQHLTVAVTQGGSGQTLESWHVLRFDTAEKKM